LVLAWGAFLLMRPPVASAIPGRLTDDSYTTAGSGTTHGLVGVLHVTDAPSEKAFVQFDLAAVSTALPAVTGADVEKATLTIFVDGVGAGGMFDVVKVTSGW